MSKRNMTKRAALTVLIEEAAKAVSGTGCGIREPVTVARRGSVVSAIRRLWRDVYQRDVDDAALGNMGLWPTGIDIPTTPQWADEDVIEIDENGIVHGPSERRPAVLRHPVGEYTIQHPLVRIEGALDDTWAFSDDLAKMCDEDVVDLVREDEGRFLNSAAWTIVRA